MLDDIFKYSVVFRKLWITLLLISGNHYNVMNESFVIRQVNTDTGWLGRRVR